MAKLSLHVGLRRIDDDVFTRLFVGETGQNDLPGCDIDAEQLAALARTFNFTPTVLTNDRAKEKEVLEAIDHARVSLAAGETFLLTYSGHGMMMPGGNENLWVLFDKAVRDTTISLRWPKFKPGVRVVLIFDACSSQTMGFSDKVRLSIKNFLAGMFGVGTFARLDRVRKAPPDEFPNEPSAAVAPPATTDSMLVAQGGPTIFSLAAAPDGFTIRRGIDPGSPSDFTASVLAVHAAEALTGGCSELFQRVKLRFATTTSASIGPSDASFLTKGDALRD